MTDLTATERFYVDFALNLAQAYRRVLGSDPYGAVERLKRKPAAMSKVNLTAFERRLYDALYAADGAVVTRGELLARLFGEQANYTVADNADLRSLIYHLRHFKGVEITNVKGVGYQLGSTRCPTCGTERRG